MYYKYIGKTGKLFKHNETYKIEYVSKYDSYVCTDNMKILSPNDVYQDFRKVYLDKDNFEFIVETEDHDFEFYDMKRLLAIG